MTEELQEVWPRRPVIAAAEMGFGHLRAAHALADAVSTRVLRVDSPPLAGRTEAMIWSLSRSIYEGLSRASQGGASSSLVAPLLEWITRIENADADRPSSLVFPEVQALDFLARCGFAAGPAREAAAAQAPLLTTFFVPALAANCLPYDRTWCVVTDADVSRAWAPSEPETTHVRYLTPSTQATRRLISYGVRPEMIKTTGFPLPAELLGGRRLSLLRENLARRLARLAREMDGDSDIWNRAEEALGTIPHTCDQPVRITIAVGGAGAQTLLAKRLLEALRPGVEDRRFEIVLVAGVREATAEQLSVAVRAAGLEFEGVRVLHSLDLTTYFADFNQSLARTDVLWTKPSELSFFAALGIPLLLAPPVGCQEVHNRSYLLARGAAFDQGDPARFATTLDRLLADGTLARLAWNGFRRLPKRGLYRILDTVCNDSARQS